MALRARFAKLSDVPADLKALYKAEDKAKGDDSPAVLDVEGSDGFSLVNAGALLAQVTKAQADYKRANEKLQRYKRGGDENPDALWEPDEISALATRLAEAESSRGKPQDSDTIQKRIAAEVAAALKPLQAKLADSEKNGQTLRSRFEQALLDRDVDASLAEAGILPQYLPLLRPHVRGALAIEEAGDGLHTRVRGENGEGYRLSINGNAGAPMPLKPTDYVRDTVRQQYPTMFRGDGASGAGVNSNGSRGGGGGNRFRITSSELEKDSSKLVTLEAQAKAAGQQVEVVDG